MCRCVCVCVGIYAIEWKVNFLTNSQKVWMPSPSPSPSPCLIPVPTPSRKVASWLSSLIVIVPHWLWTVCLCPVCCHCTCSSSVDCRMCSWAVGRLGGWALSSSDLKWHTRTSPYRCCQLPVAESRACASALTQYASKLGQNGFMNSLKDAAATRKFPLELKRKNLTQHFLNVNKAQTVLFLVRHK